MDHRKKCSSAAFALIVVLVISIVALYFFNIVTWAGCPDFGFVFHTATGIDRIGEVTDHGRRAGLRLGDRLLRLNGKEFASIEEIRSIVHSGIGEENRYLIEREGRRIEIAVTNVPIGFRRSFAKSGLLLLLGLCYVVIGTLVFLMKPHHKTSWIFLLFTCTLGLFILFIYRVSKMTPFWLETVHMLTYMLTPAVFIHLALSFPEERGVLHEYPYIQVLPFGISLIGFLAIRSVTPTMTDIPRLWQLLLALYIAAGVLFFLGSCMQHWLFSPSAMVRIRSKLILIGSAIAALAPIEIARAQKILGLGGQKIESFDQLADFMPQALELILPDSVFSKFRFVPSEANVFHWEWASENCFAYKGMKQMGTIDGYSCGVMYRIECWLTALGIDYQIEPRPDGCLMHQTGSCVGDIRVAL